MESVNLIHDGNFIPEPSLKQFNSLGSAEISDICGDPQMEPRVGNQYQVEIPPMITEAERLQILIDPFDSEVKDNVSHLFLVGLPMPIAWVHDEANDKEDERWRLLCKSNNNVSVNRCVGSGNSKGGLIINLKRKSSKLKVEPFTIDLDHDKEYIPVNLPNKVEQISNLDPLDKVKSCFPVPGSLGDPWSDADINSFLLGLYIYGKNFVQVMRFIKNKQMGEILSFYYGLFYKSDRYCRWSSSRNSRSRKCVNGHKIFTGWRQQELISRLLPHVPQESQKTLVEKLSAAKFHLFRRENKLPVKKVSKAFAEGKTSLDEYISFLKSTVGICVLVDAVGIGKGKEDLTSLVTDSVKTKQHFPVCPKIPSGQACSSLTPSDIIKFLTGGFRLSKARCNDIFWEAVWPRLLARGWQSEQPKNQSCATSKNFLVFLMPGIQKFSRRKLVKGIHYFDSVTDVLSKVASEPKLIELETEESRVSCHTEEENVEQDNLSDDQRRRYLKPQVSTCNVNHMKFTVVDTSLDREGKSSNIRELRPLPVELKRTSINEGNCSEDSEDESELDAADRPSNGEKKEVISNHRTGAFYGGPDLIKFTVVDTTLVRGGKTSKLGVLRYSPISLTSEIVSFQRKSFGGSQEPESAQMGLSGKKDIMDADQSKDKFNSGSRVHKFSVVDTSIVCGEKSSDVSEVRYVSVDLTSKLTNLRENLGNSSEDSLDQHDSDTADIQLNYKRSMKNANHSKGISDDNESNQNAKINESGAGNKTNYLQSQKTYDEKRPKVTIKFQFSRRAKSDHSSSLALPAKRRRLSDCCKVETSRITKIRSPDESKELESCCALGLPDASNNVQSQEGQSEKLPSVRSAKVCLEEESSEGPVSGNRCYMDMSHKPSEKHQPKPLIDLNLPQLPLVEVENGCGCTNADESCSVSNMYELVDGPVASGNSIGIVGAMEQGNLNPRRQSTRNRPLTAKALEALANGFLNMKQRRKRSEDESQDYMFSNPSRRARSRARASSHYGSTSTSTGTVDDVKEENEEKGVVDKLYGCSSHTRTVDLV